MIEDDLRAFDDEEAFASPMDCDNYENEFSCLFLKNRKQRKNLTGGKQRYSSICDAGAQWKTEWPITCRVFANESA